MSEDGQVPPFFDDFLAEADELLTETGQLLEGLEGFRPSIQQDRLRTILRHVHTLKGLTGMVELDEAAKMAHIIESFLLSSGETLDVEEKIVELLRGSTRELRRCIEDPRSADHSVDKYRKLFASFASRPTLETLPIAPEATSWVTRLPEEVQKSLSQAEKEMVTSALGDGMGLSLCTFQPTTELAQKGMTVNAVRDALGSRADLVKVVPRVQGKEVRFAFLLLTEEALDFTDLNVESTCLSLPKSRPVTPSSASSEPRALSRVGIRVDVDRLDEVMRYVENLVVSRYRLEQRLDELNLPRNRSGGVKEASFRMQRELRELTEAVVRVRLVPVSDVFKRMPLVVRDLASESQKRVSVVLSGEDTRMDKSLVEQLLDPLVHLVRNAVAHGLEEPEERQAMGKPPLGTIRLEARSDGNFVSITLSDDGRGIQTDLLKSQGSEGTDPDLLELICRPGLSVRQEAGLDAGRGMGMDIVRRAVEGMNGTLELRSIAGQGTTFAITLPLTMAILDALMVEAGGQLFALPLDNVEEIVEIQTDSVTQVQKKQILTHRERLIPFFRLVSLLKLDHAKQENLAVLFHNHGGLVAVAVDRVVGIREVVVRPLRDPLVARPWMSGAAELGDGSLVLILQLRALVGQAA